MPNNPGQPCAAGSAIAFSALALLAVLCLTRPAQAEEMPAALVNTSAEAVANTPVSGATLANAPAAVAYVIRVVHDRLTIDVQDAAFKDVMQEIGRQAGFETLISPDVGSRVLSTKFSDMQMQRALQRLLTLISHRNYFIYYRPDDSIKKIEIYGAGSLPTPAEKKTWTPQVPARPARPAAVPSARVPATPKPAARMTPMEPPMVTDEGETYTGGDDNALPPPESITSDDGPDTELPATEEPDMSVPYIAPVEAPEYIPPQKRIDR